MTLFRAEWGRLALPAVLVALVHLGALMFLSRMLDLGQLTLAAHWSFAAVYALTGALLGIGQFHGYARPNTWLSLIHRPQAPLAIARALLGAGLLGLLLMIALPLVLTAMWQSQLTARVVDMRHWMLALAGWQIAACAYFGGVYAALSRRVLAATGLVLLFWLINARASGAQALGLQAVALLWAGWMVLAGFRANRDEAPPARHLTAIALPLAMGLYLAGLVAFAIVEVGWIAWGTHPNNSEPPPAGHHAMEKATASERMRAALASSAHPDAALLAEQVALSEPVSPRVQFSRLPQPQELSNVMPMEFDDDPRGLRYVYSHDDARLHALQIRDGKPAEGLALRFPAPPLALGRLPGMQAGDRLLLAFGSAYQYQSETRNLSLRLQLPSGEPVLGLAPVGESLAVISHLALYIYDSRPFLAHRDPVQPRARLAFQGRLGDLSNVDMIELLDGYLVVATYAARAHLPEGTPPFQTAEILRSDGHVELVARRALAHDFGWLYRYQGLWFSPPLYALREAAQAWPGPPLALDATTPGAVPRPVWWLAGLLHLLALALAWWRWRRANGAPRLGWVAAAGLGGLPMLAALWLIEPSRRSPRA